ncbi:RNI-like protein [Anaeromyces robustus]|uniref:RNI-like protein n=1 Tax=Anaeromyces robustus TaxID=1754192 RepID=A0A1Y1XQD5_9FUNG|nr:RNI-like protein [Anaeromyces robustus]|eukprot:ORX87875.1 RNI-like protein [Anaeromyces robustus]
MADMEIDIGVIKHVVESSIIGFNSIPSELRTPEVQNAMASCMLLKKYINECYEYNSIISEEFDKKKEMKTSASSTCISSEKNYNIKSSSSSCTNIKNQFKKTNDRSSRTLLPQEILLGLNSNRNSNNLFSNDRKIYNNKTSLMNLPTFTSQTNQYNGKKVHSSIETINVDTSLFSIDSIFSRNSYSSSPYSTLSTSSSSSSSVVNFSIDNNEDEKNELDEKIKTIQKTRKFDQLPKEILNNIMKYLPTSSLYHVLFVNRYMYNCALPYLWRNLNFQNTLSCFKFCTNFENNSVYHNNFALYTETFNICFPNQGMNMYKYLLDKIIYNCKNIKNIKVDKSLYWYMDKTISLFTKNCKNIERISLNGQWYQPAQTILSISKRCPKLSLLKLNHVQFTIDNVIPAFSNFHNIKHLDLSGVNINNEVLKVIIDNNYYQLTSIKLRDCTRLTDESIKPLIEKCHKLQYLDLKGCNVTRDTLVEIGNKCPKLRTLCLDGIVNVTPEVINSIAHGCPSLSVISLEKCQQVNNESIINLFKSVGSNLKHLCLSGLSLLNDDALLGLSFYCCANLEKLDVDSVSMSEFAINNIMKCCSKLKSLIVQRKNTYVTCTLSKWMQNEILNNYSTDVEDFNIPFVW